MSKVLYHKTQLELKVELNAKYPNNSTIIFMECENYKENLPNIKVSESEITIIGSPYQIFNMKRNDIGPYWDHFYNTLNIKLCKSEEEM